MKYGITLEKERVSRALIQLGKVGTAKAISMTINRVLPGVRTDAKRHIAQNAKMKRIGSVGEKISIWKSSPKNLEAKIWFQGSTELADYKNVRVDRGKGGGVTFRGKKITKSFRADIKSKKNGLWRRTENGKVHKLFGYTLTQEYYKHETPKKMKSLALERLRKEFDRSIAQQLRKLGL